MFKSCQHYYFTVGGMFYKMRDFTWSRVWLWRISGRLLTGDGASCGNPKTPDPRPEQ